MLRMEDCPLIPRQRDEDETLERLQKAHPEWEISYRRDYGGQPGAWKAARSHNPRPALQGVRYQTAEELHAALTWIEDSEEAVSAR